MDYATLAWATVDIAIGFRRYNITLGGRDVWTVPGVGLNRHEVVPKTRQRWLAAGVVCARDPVCAVVRALSRDRRAGGARDCDRPDAGRSRLHRDRCRTGRRP